jgi:hypothetical protein
VKTRIYLLCINMLKINGISEKWQKVLVLN